MNSKASTSDKQEPLLPVDIFEAFLSLIDPNEELVTSNGGIASPESSPPKRGQKRKNQSYGSSPIKRRRRSQEDMQALREAIFEVVEEDRPMTVADDV